MFSRFHHRRSVWKSYVILAGCSRCCKRLLKRAFHGSYEVVFRRGVLYRQVLGI